MTTVLLDTHVLHWWTAEPDRLSASAQDAISAADELSSLRPSAVTRPTG